MSRSNGFRMSLAAVAAVASLQVGAVAHAADPSSVNVVVTRSSGGATPGASSAGGTYRLRAVVPVACWVDPQAGLLNAADGLAGTVVEACNSPGGFTVSASYRALKSTETASLVYGGAEIDLARGGQQVLRRSTMATIRSVNYRFGAVRLDEPLILSLTIQPI